MQDFYIPLVDLQFDIDKIRKELDTIVKPPMGGTAITTTYEEAEKEKYDFSKFRSITKNDAYGVRRFITGEQDADLVYYPSCLKGSYIQTVEEMISEYLGLSFPRVRISKFIGGSPEFKQVDLSYHTDPHTPYRVHIALNSSSDIFWKFRSNDAEYIINQPANGMPVLIEVANTQHSVEIPFGKFRYHIC
jgi:hypothetical protein